MLKILEKLEKKIDDVKHDTGAILWSLEELHGKVNGLRQIVFQLHEDTVPRLFFILPENGEWDFSADGILAKNYRLYFLCEHEEMKDGKLEARFHLASHEGYPVLRPRQVYRCIR